MRLIFRLNIRLDLASSERDGGKFLDLTSSEREGGKFLDLTSSERRRWQYDLKLGVPPIAHAVR
jgi:hypothetical protein